MMGKKSNPSKFDCYSNALPDEPMFVLLARDLRAPSLVMRWALEREARIDQGLYPESDRPMIEEAKESAEKMVEWRKANDGKWRAPKDSSDGR